jgi:hypothetical protein
MYNRRTTVIKNIVFVLLLTIFRLPQSANYPIFVVLRENFIHVISLQDKIALPKRGHSRPLYIVLHNCTMSTNKRSNTSMSSNSSADVIELKYPEDNMYYIEKLNMDIAEDSEEKTIEINDPASPNGKREAKPCNAMAVDIKGNRVAIEAWQELGIATQKYLRYVSRPSINLMKIRLQLSKSSRIILLMLQTLGKIMSPVAPYTCCQL